MPQTPQSHVTGSARPQSGASPQSTLRRRRTDVERMTRHQERLVADWVRSLASARKPTSR